MLLRRWMSARVSRYDFKGIVADVGQLWWCVARVTVPLRVSQGVCRCGSVWELPHASWQTSTWPTFGRAMLEGCAVLAVFCSIALGADRSLRILGA